MPARATSSIVARIRSSDSSVYPGTTGVSPQSTIERRSATFTPSRGLYFRSIDDALRIASGPKRAPVR